MRRASLLGLVMLASTLAAPTFARPQATESRFTQLFSAYASGDFGVVERSLTSAQDYQSIRKDLRSAAHRWKHDWRPIQAVFLLEVFKASLAGKWPSAPEVRDETTDFLLSRSRSYLTAGKSRDEMDAFERQCHKTLLALLHKHLRAQDVEDYLAKIDQRVWWKPRNDADTRIIEPHLILARAIAHEQTITPDTISYYLRSNTAPLTIGALPGQNGETVKDFITETLRYYDQAAQLPTESAEASVRKAFIVHRQGKQEDALTLLTDIETRATDPTVRYWGLLFRGRALQQLGRPEDAVQAYELALAARPDTQTPAVALAALTLQLNRPDDALRWATAARSTSLDRDDPWWSYWLGDGRFVDEWLANLRKAAQ